MSETLLNQAKRPLLHLAEVRVQLLVREAAHPACPLSGVKRTFGLARRCPLMTQSGHRAAPGSEVSETNHRAGQSRRPYSAVGSDHRGLFGRLQEVTHQYLACLLLG